MTGFRASEEALHQAARDACGLDDFGDDAYLEGLRVLLGALDEEAHLNRAGEMVVRSMVVDSLRARLFSERGWALHPECAETPMERPLVILGLPRTGTTALHHLLSQDPGLQGLELWLSNTPKPRPPRDTWEDDPEYRECAALMRLLYERSPDMKAIHWMAADLVDECWRLLGQSFAHSSWEATAHVPSYSRWWARHDMRPAYRRHRRNLQLIGHREPERRWLLKDATHLFDLDAFLDVYPDALVVQTHRDPVKLMPSVCSLCWSARSPLNQKEDRAEFARATLALWERAVLHTLEVRRQRDAAQFHDVDFAAFTRDPLPTIRGIYDHFGLAYSDAADAAIHRFRDANPPGSHGQHVYVLEDWGLDPDEIRTRFRPYIETWDLG